MATFVVLEVVSRIFLGNLGSSKLLTYRPADGRPVGLKPGIVADYTGYLLKIPTLTHRVNNYGYRGSPRPREKPACDFRIALLGDFYVFGVGVEEDETAAVRLESLLAGEGRGEIEVPNFGVPGLNLEQVQEQYSLFAARWAPDVVLHALYVNDLDLPLFRGELQFAPARFMASMRNVYSPRVLFTLVALARQSGVTAEPPPSAYKKTPSRS